MEKGEYYWINLVNMVEIYGPFTSPFEAIDDALKKFKEPPDNGKDHYRVGVSVLKVDRVGEVIVRTKSRWSED